MTTAAGWPAWADTPEKRERNRRSWHAHNELVRAQRQLEVQSIILYGEVGHPLPDDL